jgi:LCP family protein required for cell wall assembly
MSDSSAPTPSVEPAAVPPRAGRLRRTLTVLGLVMAIVLGGTAVAVYLVIDRFDSNITTVDVSDRLGTQRPVASEFDNGRPINVLLMGSDTREDQGGGFGAFEGPGRSDTTILLHIAADRSNAIAVSIPRDLWVQLPLCTREDGSTVGGYSSKFNAAFAIGGPACTIQAVEDITDVFIDHYVVVDFKGFQGVVDALGGVPVCVETAVDDPLSGLRLPQGESIVDGEQALAFVRARKTLADGSDTARIARQQEFLASMVRTATDASLLRDPVRLVKVLDRATASLTTDPGLGSVTRLASFGQSLGDLRPKDVTFITVPNVPRGDGANVVLDIAEAEPLFRTLREDTGWPPPPPAPSVVGGRTLTVPPDEIQVRVLNGTGEAGVAARTAQDLEGLGFDVVGIGDADRRNYTRSALQAPADRSADAGLRTLAATTGVDLWLRDPSGSSVLTVIVGADGVKAVPVVLPATTPPTTAPTTATPGATSPSGPTSSPSPTPGQPRTAADRICSS